MSSGKNNTGIMQCCLIMHCKYDVLKLDNSLLWMMVTERKWLHVSHMEPKIHSLNSDLTYPVNLGIKCLQTGSWLSLTRPSQNVDLSSHVSDSNLNTVINHVPCFSIKNQERFLQMTDQAYCKCLQHWRSSMGDLHSSSTHQRSFQPSELNPRASLFYRARGVIEVP